MLNQKTDEAVTRKFDDKYYEYLNELRESGETNMFGATPYLVDAFDLDKTKAREILSDWMTTFGK